MTQTQADTMAKVLRLSPVHRDAVFHEVAAVIRTGGIVAIPTESSYGLAVSPFDQQALDRLGRIKDRPSDKPILVLISDQAQLKSLVQNIPPAARLLMNAFWPGPLTIIFPAASTISTVLTAGTGSIGIRQTPFPMLQDLLRVVGPLTGTSANRSGAAPALTADAIQSIFGSEVDLILDGGTTPGGAPSTVLDARDPVLLVREGPVRRSDVIRVLQRGGFTLQ